MTEPIDLESLLRVPHVDPDLGFDISPSGSQVAFSWNLTGQWEIYTQEINGDPQPRQITSGEGAKFSPRYSPDGKKLAYVLDWDGSENFDIFVLNLTTGEQRNLTPNTPYAIMPGYAWSPDGDWIAFSSNRDGQFNTFIMPSSAGQARKVLDQPHPDWEVFWSPDVSMLAVVVEGQGQDHWIYLVPLAGGEAFPIAIHGEPICAKDACWAPDGQSLAFTSNFNGQFEIGIYELASDSIIWLTDGAGEKERPDWSNEGLLAYILSQGPKSELALMDISSRKVDTFQIEPGVIFTPKFSPTSEQIIFVFDNPRHPPDLWTFSPSDHTFRQFTHSLPVTIQHTGLAMPKEIHYPSLDGMLVPALLYSPMEQDELPPAVLYVHGGPNWLTQFTWDPLVQHMVSRGWVVLAPNYRGSTGFGRAWQLASRFDFGGVDSADVAAGADFLQHQGIAAPNNIAVTGKSWGGYLTMTCLTQYPDLWSAGSAVVPFLNWFTGHANSRQDLQHWDRENFGDPQSNHQLWHERSPFFFLDRLQAPVQLICGAHDVRCPPGESTQAYEHLTALGKVCEYILYPDEGHSFLKVDNQVKSKLQQVNFLARYLDSDHSRKG
ncbi:MAG TPA: S9 family peptidase [Anaerolineales bacterium]|nr:S9 family peptidase [Anaerolineales bacterium]